MDTYFPTSNNQRDRVATPYTVDPEIDSYSEIPLCSNRIVTGLNHGPAHEFYSTASIGMSQSPSDCVEAMEGRCEMAFIREFGDPLFRQNIRCGGLSLSLGSKTPLSAGNQSAMEMEYFPNSSSLATLGKTSSNVYDHLDSSVLAGTGMDSKYVKAAQQLLDEVVNVRAALNELISNKNKSVLYGSNDNIGRSNGGSFDLSCHELSPEERQDLKNKSAKLLAMVEEVDERYRQYYQQMQILSSSFDTISGWGAAAFYTALAHQTISRHFRRLRDGISDQIQVTRRRLGEEDCSSGSQRGFPRLRNVDQKLRQDMALQQLGLTRHSWRPQRGLPESSVSILRAWLFEHFLHPYPKDSEKLMLAKQTGLTRHQVANWFINARVRLWKPMVEEMYKEEFGDPKTGFNFSLENTSRAPEDREEDLQDGTVSSNADGDQIQEPNLNKYNENAENTARTTTLYPREISLPSQVSLALELRHCESNSSNPDSVHNSEESRMGKGNCRLGSPQLLHDLVGL